MGVTSVSIGEREDEMAVSKASLTGESTEMGDAMLFIGGEMIFEGGGVALDGIDTCSTGDVMTRAADRP